MQASQDANSSYGICKGERYATEFPSKFADGKSALDLLKIDLPCTSLNLEHDHLCCGMDKDLFPISPIDFKANLLLNVENCLKF